jgi:hypothetical protein
VFPYFSPDQNTPSDPPAPATDDPTYLGSIFSGIRISPATRIQSTLGSPSLGASTS